MAQRKHSVQLTQTAWVRLQTLVDSGQFASIDDAASFIITQSLTPSVLPSTAQYSPVLTPTPPVAAQTETKPTQASTPVERTHEYRPKNALAMLKHAQQTTEVQ